MPDDKPKGETDVKPYKLSDDPEYQKLKEVVGALGAGLKSIQSSQEALLEQLKTSNKPPDNQDDGPGDDDINSMSQAELVAFMAKQMQKAISSAVSPLREDVDSTKDEFTKNQLKTELNKFADEHPGVYDFIDELKVLFNETPGLSISRAYAIVRDENPEKASEIDKKYSGDDKEEATRPKFGGLTPTSGLTLGGESEEKLTPKEAAEKAWNDVFADFPVLAGEDVPD